MLGINGLVAFLIFLVGLALDVFRKRGLSEFLQLLAEFFLAAFPEKTDRSSSAGSVIDYLCYKILLIAEVKFVAYANLSCGINDHIPKPVWLVQFPEQEDFNLRARFLLPPIHSGRENLSVVYHEYILVVEVILDVAEMLVFNLAGMTVNHHHSCVFTFFSRILSNKIKWKVETEL